MPFMAKIAKAVMTIARCVSMHTICVICHTVLSLYPAMSNDLVGLELSCLTEK